MALFCKSKFRWFVLPIQSGWFAAFNLILIGLLFYVGKAVFLEEQTVRDINTDTIILIGDLCDLMHDNSDLMMRFSHYTNRHHPSEEVWFCPECSMGNTSIIGKDNTTDTPQNPVRWWPGNYRQSLSKDAQEVRSGILGISGGLLIQKETLTRTLDRLRIGVITADDDHSE